MNALHVYGSGTLAEDGCVTCGDSCVPVRVLAAGNRVALCEDRAGYRAEIATDFVDGVEVGDVLLVHTGVAIAKAPRGDSE